MTRKLSILLFSGIICIMVLSGCYMPKTQVTETAPTPEPTAAEVQAATPEPAPTQVISRTLTICMGQEPNTLYPFGSLNSAARSILGTVYDGPVDTFTNGYQPVILDKLPTMEDGDAQVAAVKVKRGDSVIDSSGKLAVLDFGVTVFPSGCKEDACSVKYDGRPDLTMDQMIVTYKLKKDIKWSDGKPLTAADSVFAYKLAADPATPGSKYLVERTSAYDAVDDLTLQWWGVPGFITASYQANLWSPLPKHLWEKVSAADLAKGDFSTYPPLGWGPYVFKEWAAGNYIKMEKNTAYFRSSEGLPRFDSLVFLFVKDAPTGISSLIAGQCDVLDTSLRLDGEIDLLTELQRSDQVKLLTSTTPLIERLDLGIKPASYDDGYAPGLGDRQDMFGDVRTRQGIAYCLDRQRVVTSVLSGISQVPDTFISPSHPLFNAAAQKYTFNVNSGISLLDQAGWKDADSNPATPRVAVTVKNVVIGTPLVVDYLTTTALQRRQVTEILTESLAQCGIGLNVKYMDQQEIFAPGPDGPLFGRKFDLAEYALGTNGTEPPCAWFTSDQIPSKTNKWLGVNISGYTNLDYDAQCRKAVNSLPGTQDYKDAYAAVQSIFAADLPSIPLYMRIKAEAARRDMCNFSLDAFSVNDLWNIEDLDYGPNCGG
ncbi:MAG: ABC transporter substrate-binding protein [Chloroflexota bacterium]